MRRTMLLAAALIAGWASLAACSGSGGSSTPTARPPVEPTIRTTPVALGTSADADLTSALLAAEDLGPGWVEQSIEGATKADAYYCGVRLTLPAPAAIRVLANDDAGRAIFEALTRYDSASAAAADLESARRAHDGCSDYVSTDGDQRTEYHVESFGPANIGDDAVVERATLVSGTGVTYLFVIRSGAILLSIATPGADAPDATSADNARIEATTRARQAYEKLARAVNADQ